MKSQQELIDELLSLTKGSKIVNIYGPDPTDEEILKYGLDHKKYRRIISELRDYGYFTSSNELPKPILLIPKPENPLVCVGNHISKNKFVHDSGCYIIDSDYPLEELLLVYSDKVEVLKLLSQKAYRICPT